MYLTQDVKPEDYEVYDHPGVKGIRRRRLLNPDNSSKRFALRTYIIEPGGHTSFDVHPEEHGVYIMKGEVTVVVGEKEFNLGPGDVIHIAENEPHQFMNRQSELVKFLCVRDFPSV
ncbi:MAG: cupin domain-containing protein [Candidatus Thorarchaeota archaeon]|jgi:quercetin dioxygenase-like cupin family protein|nr:cupin domain-containing protein [Candidatus Thorarchaeota archaeon]